MKETAYMIECMTRDLTLLLMEKEGMTMKEAMNVLYTSDTFEKLQNEQTGLCFQSPGYVYDFLHTELTTGKMG